MHQKRSGTSLVMQWLKSHHCLRGPAATTSRTETLM